MLKVWGRRTSSNVQAVMWGIAELGLEAERYDVGHIYGGNDTPEFLGMNPNGKVPVLQDGDDLPLFESAAILRYLASRYGDGGSFWPADPVARADVDRWAEWAKITVSMRFTGPVFWPVARTRPENRNEAALAAAICALSDTLAIAEDRLARHDYLAGSDFTLADIPFGTILFRYHTIEIDRPSLPALRAYYDRLTARGPYADHVMVDYAELAPRD